MTEIKTSIDLSQTYQAHRRDVITKLVSFCDFDTLIKMGIKIIEKEGVPNVGCRGAAFPPSKYPRDILSKVISTWAVADSPQPGDAAIYFNRESKAVAHVGRVINKNRVRSRWGSGGILCEHSPLDVPVYCGREIVIIYFREPK